MSTSDKDRKGVTRRGFVKGVAAVAGTAGLAVATGGAALLMPEEAQASASVAVMPKKRHYEADVVVLGTGFAGQTVAITAHDAGASVLMIEKAPQKDQGGNSRVCGQGFLSPTKAIWDDYFKYLKQMTTGVGMPVPDEQLRLFVEESSKNVEWFKSMGATVSPDVELGIPLGTWIPFYSHFPGAKAIATEPGYYSVTGKYKGPGSNWYFLEDQVLQRKKIRKLFETPAKRLIQNPLTREIFGVVAERGGKEIFIKAKRAVCVCSGGFEYNMQMKRDFQGQPVPSYTYGSPYNTGETIKMCWAAGADIRAMSSFSSPCRYSAGMKPGVHAALRAEPMFLKGVCIMVGANNKRWFDEYRPRMAGMQYLGVSHLEGACADTGTVIENGVFVKMKFPMPMHMIFDEEARKSKNVFAGSSWAEEVGGLKLSKDNSEEIEKGWITKADNIRELAAKIGRNPDELEATINRWNKSCEAGKDLEFDKGDPNFVPYYRKPANFKPIIGGPLYALEVFPVNLNTQGGMKRNTLGQVIDINDKPIPRLYSAGENGDIWTWLYQCMSNVGAGCYGFGRIAGKNASAEKPWKG